MRGSLFVAVALALPAAASAQTESPDAMFERGRALRAARNDAAALAVFQQMYQQTQQPRALAQVGLAEGALGRWVEAEQHLGAALATRTDPWIEQNRVGGVNLTGAFDRVRARAWLTSDGSGASGASGGAARSAGVPVWAWIGFAGSAALLATGVVTAVLAQGAADEWNDDSMCLTGPGSREAVCGDRRSSAELLRGVSIGGFVGAAVLGGVGVLGVVLGQRGGTERSGAVCTPAAGSWGIQCAARF